MFIVSGSTPLPHSSVKNSGYSPVRGTLRVQVQDMKVIDAAPEQGPVYT